jgi:proton-translocating NADH-quinone oxidoreductase chain N
VALPIFAWLIWLPLLSSPLVYLAGRLSARRRQSSQKEVTWLQLAPWIALAGLLVTWAALMMTWQEFNQHGPATFTLGTVALRLDGLSLLLAVIVLVLSTLVTFYSGPLMVDGTSVDGTSAAVSGEEKYYALLLALTGTMIGLSCAADLFNLWLWFEAMAITTYLLVAFYRQQSASLEAGVKVLVQSAAGSVLVLLAIALVLAETGTLDAASVPAMRQPIVLAAGALFTVGFGVKIALVPMHTWLADAHAQAPSGISAILSGVVIEMGLIALLRALSILAGSAIVWGELLLAFAVLNMLAGNLLALRQTQVKRLLAFSTISHVGYMLLGLGIALYAGSAAGAQGGLFHLLSHGLMKGLAFLAAGALLYALSSAHSLTIADLAGAARRYPLLALTFSLALLGLGGLPPLVGFASKWQILAAGITSHSLLIYGLVALAALNSVLSLAYYAPLVNALYRQQPSAAVLAGRPLPLQMNAPLLLLGLAVVAIGVWPNLARWLVEPAAAALLAAFGA